MKDKAGEWLYYWNLLMPGMEEPEAEYKFAEPRRYRFDWAFPRLKVAVEVDGGQFAPLGGRHAGDKDREKLNLAASLGWRVFRFSPGQLKDDPAGCLELVRRSLR